MPALNFCPVCGRDRTGEYTCSDNETRLYRLYDEIEGVEKQYRRSQRNRLLNIRQQKISEEKRLSISFIF